MKRVLNRRNLRSLRSGFPRYLALLLLIVMGVYLIISIVGSAEMVIQGTENQKEKNKVEFFSREEAVDKHYKPCSRCSP